MILTLASFNIAVTVAGGMVTVKSVAFKLARRLRLISLGLPLVVVAVALLPDPVVTVPVVVLMLFCNATVADVGGLIPRFFILSRLICITATSTMTSDFALSRSPTSLVARAI